MKHLANKIGLLPGKVPIILGEFGNTGGCSIPLAITQGKLSRPHDRALKLMLVGYGVGLSWASALVYLEPDAVLTHSELDTKGKVT
jgi:3-oxoacyl-[acyl-carrier-protein] synthase-3